MDRQKPILVGLITLILLVILGFWGGLPAESEIAKFVIGLVIMLSIGIGICILGWYFLFRPVPFAVEKKNVLTKSQRQLMGAVLIIGSSLEAIGGTWDEAWHGRYGIPFGKDFFWRPHLLIYAALITIIVASILAWVAILRNRHGNLTQWFRADPLVSLVLLLGIVLMFTVPADPIWHTIYGTDLSAFSFPHILLGLLLMISFLIGSSLMISARPMREWGSLLRFNSDDMMPILALSFAMLGLMLLLTADWFSLARSTVLSDTTQSALRRPEWVFPALVMLLSVVFGTLANHSLRRYGAATLLGLVCFGTRLLLINAFNNTILNANTWLLVLPSMIAIDVLYAVQTRNNQSPKWWMTGLAAAIGGLFTLPLINLFVAFPTVTLANLPLMVLFPGLVAFVASWLGQTLGDYLVAPHQMTVNTANPVSKSAGLASWVIPAITLATVIFLIWFVVTAVPPVFTA